MVLMRPAEIRPARRATREKGQLVAGLRYVWSIPALRTTLLMTAVIGTLSFNFQVTLSLMAKKVFNGDAGTFGALYALMSVGALVGSLVVAHREKASTRFVVWSALLFGGFMLVAAASPTLVTMAIVLIPMGATSIAFLSSADFIMNPDDPSYRGRVAAPFSHPALSGCTDRRSHRRVDLRDLRRPGRLGARRRHRGGNCPLGSLGPAEAGGRARRGPRPRVARVAIRSRAVARYARTRRRSRDGGTTVEVPLTITDFIERAETVFADRVAVVDEPDPPGGSLGRPTWRDRSGAGQVRST